MSVGNNYDVIVVGGGAAGLMAAGVCAERGRRTAVFEKNEKLGRKLRITGKGRCNVTNNCTVQEVIACTPRGGKFLYGALSAFPPEETMRFFENLGIPLKTERGRRVFPVSDRADDIADALAGFARENGAQAVREPVQSVLAERYWGCAPPEASIAPARCCWPAGAPPIQEQAQTGTATGWQERWDIRSALLCRPWCLWWSRAATARK